MPFRRATAPRLADPIAAARAQRGEVETDPDLDKALAELPRSPSIWKAADQVSIVGGTRRPMPPRKPLPIDESARQVGGSGSTIPMGIHTRGWRHTG